MGIDLMIPVILISIMVVWWVVLWVYGRLQIKEPTRKIAKILLDTDHFVYLATSGGVEVGAYSTRRYVLRHVPSEDVTYINRDNFNDHWWVTGDLEWMNSYEQDLIGSLINSDHQRKLDNHKEACDIEKEARDKRFRELAKEKY